MRKIGFEIILSLLVTSLFFVACEQDTEGPLFGDLGSFTNTAFSKSIKADNNVIRVGVTHRNHLKKSKLKLLIEPRTNTPEGLCTLSSDIVSFENSDTVWVELTVNYSQLTNDGFYSYIIKIAQGENDCLEPMQYGDGIDETVVSFSKYIPLDRTPFLGEFTEFDGDGEYDVVITADPTDEFGLIVTGGNWGPSASYKVRFNTNKKITIVEKQFIGVNYPGINGTTGQVYYSPATNNKQGSYDAVAKEFSVFVNMSLPNYPYNLGNFELDYYK